MTDLRPLVPNITPRHLRREALSKSEIDRATIGLRQIKPNILTKLDYTCEFCGYHEDAESIRQMSYSTGEAIPKSHLEIVFFDGDIRNTSIDNLGVACAFCAPVLSLNTLPQQQQWHVAWLPLYEQSGISLLSVSLMMLECMLNDHDNSADSVDRTKPVLRGYAAALTSMRTELADEMRGAVAYARMRLGSSSATDFAAMLERISIDIMPQFNRREMFGRGFVLLPDAMVRNDWRMFHGTLNSIRAGGSIAGVTSLWDLISLGKRVFSLADRR
jgi:hypothetical protein